MPYNKTVRVSISSSFCAHKVVKLYVLWSLHTSARHSRCGPNLSTMQFTEWIWFTFVHERFCTRTIWYKCKIEGFMHAVCQNKTFLDLCKVV